MVNQRNSSHLKRTSGLDAWKSKMTTLWTTQHSPLVRSIRVLSSRQWALLVTRPCSKELGWKPKISLDILAKRMVESDIKWACNQTSTGHPATAAKKVRKLSDIQILVSHVEGINDERQLWYKAVWGESRLAKTLILDMGVILWCGFPRQRITKLTVSCGFWQFG